MYIATEALESVKEMTVFLSMAPILCFNSMVLQE
jgi:hypothetical protein